jgi:thimet oligopeptidase
MPRSALLMVVALATGSGAVSGVVPDAGPAYVMPTYDSAAQVAASCQHLIDESRVQEAQIESLDPADGASLLSAFDRQTQRYEDTLGPLSLMVAVHPDKRIRDAADACDLRYQAFAAGFQQNPRLHALLKQMHPADAIDARMQRDLLDAFEDAGADLAPAAQARAKLINAEIATQVQAFERRIREDRTHLAFTAAELDGVPDEVWRGAARDAQGRYRLGLDEPTADPVIERATDGATRERMWRARSVLGGRANLAALARIASLRRAYAQLFGFGSYDDFVLRRRMAASPARVQSFLAEVKDAVRQRELADLAVLREAKAQHLNRPTAATRLHRWDLAFYTERARHARYGVDQEQFRAYFPPEASLAFVFKLAEHLFGIRFRPLTQPLWHPDARAFAVMEGRAEGGATPDSIAGDSRDRESRDRESRDREPRDREPREGPLLGTLYVDLYPRADKYRQAEVESFRNVSTRVGRRPAAALIVNFNRQGLSIDELETLLHEFGHALHALLSATRYAAQGGTNVLLDFSEAPSQMLEDWVYDPQVLALFQEVCATCKPMPPELIAGAARARRFGQGIAIARQHLYASYDLALHGADPVDPLALWQRMEGDTPLGYEPGSLFPASFSHITQDYAAGYYGYLWSLVLAEDLRTGFAGHRLDPAVGARYRASVLANGGQVAPSELVRRFLGRDSDSHAFFRALNQP